MNNLTIEAFHHNLLNLINNCGLPVGTAYYVLKDVYKDIENLYNRALAEEQANPPKNETKSFDINLANLDEEQKENNNE